MEKQIKCEHCSHWNEANKENCVSCGGVLNEVYRNEKKALADAKGMRLPLIEIGEGENFLIKGFKHIFRIGQLIFFAIISVIAAISASTVH